MLATYRTAPTDLLARLRRLHGNVALFSHGEFGCSLGARWIGLPVLQGEHLQLGTASLSILGFNPGLHVIAQWNMQAPHADTAPTSTVPTPQRIDLPVFPKRLEA